MLRHPKVYSDSDSEHRYCDCSFADCFLTSSLSLTHKHAHTPHPPPHVVVSSSTLSVPCTDKDFSLDSVRSGLLDEGAIPCERHVIDDTPRFLAIVILNTSVCDCLVADSFLTSSLSLLHTSMHIHLTPATCCCFFIRVPCTDKDFSLDSVKTVLLDEGAIPCECHVVDDTPRFLAIVILNTSVCHCSVADSFLTSSLSLLHTSTHIHLTPATCGSF